MKQYDILQLAVYLAILLGSDDNICILSTQFRNNRTNQF